MIPDWACILGPKGDDAEQALRVLGGERWCEAHGCWVREGFACWYCDSPLTFELDRAESNAGIGIDVAR